MLVWIAPDPPLLSAVETTTTMTMTNIGVSNTRLATSVRHHRVDGGRRRHRTTTTTRAVGGGDDKRAVLSDTTPQPFTVREGELGKVASAALPLVLRFATGVLIGGYSPSLVDDDGGYSVVRFGNKMLKERSKTLPATRPSEPIVMYEYEGSPYCRKVRDAASLLDLDILFKPCPQGSDAFRAESKALGAKTYPFMVDPNNNSLAMGESDDIVEYLFERYGGETKIPFLLKRDGALTNFTAYAAAVSRLKALRARKAKTMPEKPLVLYTYEISPFSKLVREVLTELCIPHIVRYTPRGSSKRDSLYARVGHFQVPYLEDDNTGARMFESKDIVAYIEKTYGSD